LTPIPARRNAGAVLAAYGYSTSHCLFDGELIEEIALHLRREREIADLRFQVQQNKAWQTGVQRAVMNNIADQYR
jgi:hypothetical protein